MESKLPKCCQNCDFWKGPEKPYDDFNTKQTWQLRKCTNQNCQFRGKLMRHCYSNCIAYKEKQSS